MACMLIANVAAEPQRAVMDTSQHQSENRMICMWDIPDFILATGKGTRNLKKGEIMREYEVEAKIPQNALSSNMESTRQRLMRQKKDLEERLADVNHALDLLEKNPILEEFQDVMRRV